MQRSDGKDLLSESDGRKSEACQPSQRKYGESGLGEALFADVCRLGLEGMIAKHLTSATGQIDAPTPGLRLNRSPKFRVLVGIPERTPCESKDQAGRQESLAEPQKRGRNHI